MRALHLPRVDPATRHASPAIQARSERSRSAACSQTRRGELALPLVLLGASYTVEGRHVAGRPLLEGTGACLSRDIEAVGVGHRRDLLG
jgi:hypothetical protein